MSDFLLADNALGFTPFALVAAIYLFWRSAHFEGVLRPRDVIVDLFFIVPLVFVACFILFVLPGSMSWYFWLNRMDLAAMVPWTVAVAIVFLGYQQMLRTWPAWLMLTFAWPYPAVWLQRILADPLVAATGWVGRAATDFARLPYEVGEGGTVQLDATGTTHPTQNPATLAYQWDLDGDGLCGEAGAGAGRGDEVGATPTLDAAAIDGSEELTVALKVTDSGGRTGVDHATVEVETVRPTLTLGGPAEFVPSQSDASLRVGVMPPIMPTRPPTEPTLPG